MEIRQIYLHEAALVVNLFDQYRVFYKQASDLKRAQQFIEARLGNNESVIFVAFAELNGQKHPVGFTQLYPTYSSVRTIRNWILNDLFVQDAFRENGIGEALIRRAMQFSVASGAHFLQLETAVDNLTAQKLYERIGFRQKQPDTDFLVYRIPLI
ncbi:GNAT family N-acetyltransferase [Niabella drilacis]|uniref:Acetyltransferase (GNAT) family protein n=1 Tax=Niabella drilacis (strain DSM 25811 / CCM 8410 / CCUG 62505 / LMG 26954 / E90) TaxID=1285928 RepID=A0A1G6R2X7_NIADE|nr:GNAT family N-acetyltransferase [Niabella drilacis]SDC98871.1 Acetyltransferase (GNAT) family protein [Niabella drilacis]